MNEEELIKTWQSSSDEASLRLEKSSMINAVQPEVDRWSNMLKSRDSVVIIVLLFVIPVLGMVAYTIPITLSKIGAIVCILSLLYWIIRLRITKKLKPRNFSETYIEYLNHIRKHLIAEKKLLNDTLYWCLTTLSAGIMLHHLGSFNTIQELILKILLVIGVLVLAYFYNRSVLKKGISPKLEQVENLIKVLKE